jgi:hypothetical protein
MNTNINEFYSFGRQGSAELLCYQAFPSGARLLCSVIVRSIHIISLYYAIYGIYSCEGSIGIRLLYLVSSLLFPLNLVWLIIDEIRLTHLVPSSAYVLVTSAELVQIVRNNNITDVFKKLQENYSNSGFGNCLEKIRNGGKEENAVDAAYENLNRLIEKIQLSIGKGELSIAGVGLCSCVFRYVADKGVPPLFLRLIRSNEDESMDFCTNPCAIAYMEETRKNPNFAGRAVACSWLGEKLASKSYGYFSSPTFAAHKVDDSGIVMSSAGDQTGADVMNEWML